MLNHELAVRVEQLVAQRQPFVLATVVRARRPTSVRSGDAAVVLADGTIEGFVGGVCAASSVRLQSLRALETGDPLLLRLVPEDDDGSERTDVPDGFADGAVIERNPCLSGGSLEIFLEPRLPAARLAIIGDSPIARALERVGQAAGYDCRRTSSGSRDAMRGAAAVIVASHGSGEEAVLAAALQAGVPYVALVASAKRAAAVRSELALADELRAQLRTPAGLRIGARSPNEIAVSILAELIERQHAHPDASATGGPEPEAEMVMPSAVAVATDPVCGMRVAVTDATPRLRIGEDTVYFCGEGCRNRYAQQRPETGAVS
ncbi:MAG: XdhC family protein [Actinomycetota bacterium]|nr:XdhC family protein [Actinomycetota bacterium]